MPLQKNPININFSQGLDTKTDPKQVQLGKFLNLKNSVFGEDGALQKRNGYGAKAPITADTSTYLTTLNENLTTIGSSISAYIEGPNTWVTKGNIQPLSLNTIPLVRNSVNQSQADSVISPNGLVCTVYTEVNAAASTYKYVIADAATGQNIIAPTVIIPTAGVVTGSPRVFILDKYFVIVFTTLISATSHLQYIGVSSYMPSAPTAARDIAPSYIAYSRLSWDGVVANNNLYLAYDTNSGGQSIKMTYLSVSQAASGGAAVAAVTFASEVATIMSLCADVTVPSAPVIYVSYYDSGSTVGKTFAVDRNLNTLMSPTSVITSGNILNIASAAQNGSLSYIYEIANTYSYDSSVHSNYIAKRIVTLPATITTGAVSPAAGSAASGSGVLRSIGLASKAFILNSKIYFLAAYDSSYQPTYFLINADSTDLSPLIIAKLAYGNGGGYLYTGLPGVSIQNDVVSISYLFKDLIASVNKNTNVAAGTQTAGIYSQTGVNLVSFTLAPDTISTSEAAHNLHISGGFLWQYDGYLPVEHNFFVYPDNVEATWSATGGAIAAKPDGATNTNAYFYQVTYEWSDNQGNIYRSAPSIPVAVTTSGSGTAGSITLDIPTLRLTYKVANPVKMVIYRWSVAQEVYYQVTSLASAVINDTTVDSIEYVDTLADASILGNSIIYTTGGVIEDVNAPASEVTTLFDNRMWLVDAEDPNLLWLSKEIIESTPVEMSDLLTKFIAPTVGVQGSTGPIRALGAMDDKLIIFKENAIYYMNGKGPDNTGANDQYSQPVFITSTVGCSNPISIVLMHNGLMFQSDKGIWLLDRGLNTSYIGAPVEAFNGARVQSAVNVPETTQVRFTLDTGVTLMYDYYYQQWGTFEDVPAISSCIYQNLHTYVNSFGQVYQETPGKYLDGSRPVLMSFTTSWINLAGLQGYERFYFAHLLGTHYTPFVLDIQLSYDYNDSTQQSILITPDNYSAKWGGEAQWGSGGPWGGPGNVFEVRFFPKIQKCEAFQITVNEIYDASFGVAAGQGLSLSGLNLEVGMKRGYRTQSASRSFGK